jgi:hypothetical protein
VFLVNSRYPLVCATLVSSDRKDRHQKGSSFSRSYGGNLPSSLTIVLPIALVFSTRPPVSVWGTGTVPTHCWDFLGSMGSVTSPIGSASRLSVTASTLIETRLRAYPGTTIAPDHLPSCVPQPRRRRSWTWRGHGGTGILTSCASTTPFGLALAPDLPWED